MSKESRTPAMKVKVEKVRNNKDVRNLSHNTDLEAGGIKEGAGKSHKIQAHKDQVPLYDKITEASSSLHRSPL